MRRVFPVLTGLAFALGSLVAPEPASAASMFDPAVQWKTLVTPHFRVNFPAEHEAIARLAAGYAEDAHATLAPWLDSVPENRTELTLLDHEDTVNGFGFPLPNNQIFIYLTNPSSDQLMSRHDGWLRDLLLHEYTHVLHMEKTAGLAGLVNKVFGRSYFPNMIQPIFLLEGLAVHTETKWSSGGRGREAAYRAYLRMAALEDRLASLDQACGYYTVDHPGGEIPYVYGMAFYRHLADKYGKDTPAELAKLNAENPYVGFWGLDDELKKLTGKDAEALWQEMVDGLKVDARRQRDRVLANGPITAVKTETSGGQLHRHPHFMPDGELVWAEWDGHGYSTFKGDQKKPGGPAQRLMYKSPYGGYSVSSDGRWVYHARTWDENRFTSYGDLFRYDLKAKKIERLSTRARLDDPAVSPDGRWVVAVKNGGGQTNLVKLRAEGGIERPLTRLSDRSQFSTPAWHPRRYEVTASVWKDGGRDLYTIDAETGAMQPLWRDRAVDQDPVWTPDGRYVVFSSDREGIYNLYAYQPVGKRLFRITNVLGGLIEPAVSPDGKWLAAASYGVSGWDIVRFPFERKSWVEVPFPRDERDMRQALPRTQLPPTPAIGYNPWPSLRPKTWAPFGYFDEKGPVVGFQTFGQDVLFQHYVFGSFGYGLLSNRPFYSLGYSNEVLYPSLYAYAQDSSFATAPIHEGVPRWITQQAQYQGFSATFPGLPSIFLQNQWTTGDTLTLAFNAQNIRDLDPATTASYNLPEDKAPRTGQTNSLSVTYKYGDNYKFAYSIAPEGGALAALGYERADPVLGSQYQFDRVFVDLRRYVALPWQHQALGLRLSGGANVGKQAGPFYVGGSESATLLSTVDLRTISGVGTRYIPLRGYGYGAQSGERAIAGTAEWRFPVMNVQRGYGTFPLFIRSLHGAVFTEAGQAWDGPFVWQNSLLDVGLEVRAQASVQQAPTELRAGFGQGLVAASRNVQWPVFFAEVGTVF